MEYSNQEFKLSFFHEFVKFGGINKNSAYNTINSCDDEYEHDKCGNIVTSFNRKDNAVTRKSIEDFFASTIDFLYNYIGDKFYPKQKSICKRVKNNCNYIDFSVDENSIGKIKLYSSAVYSILNVVNQNNNVSDIVVVEIPNNSIPDNLYTIQFICNGIINSLVAKPININALQNKTVFYFDKRSFINPNTYNSDICDIDICDENFFVDPIVNMYIVDCEDGITVYYNNKNCSCCSTDICKNYIEKKPCNVIYGEGTIRVFFDNNCGYIPSKICVNYIYGCEHENFKLFGSFCHEFYIFMLIAARIPLTKCSCVCSNHNIFQYKDIPNNIIDDSGKVSVLRNEYNYSAFGSRRGEVLSYQYFKNMFKFENSLLS